MKTGALTHNQLSAMAAALAASSDWAAPLLHLYTDDISVEPSTVLATLHEPTGSWYAGVTGALGDPVEEDDGSITLHGVQHRYDYTGSDPSETVRGWFLTNTAGSLLLCGGRLDAPVVMANALDSCFATPILNFPPIVELDD